MVDYNKLNARIIEVGLSKAKVADALNISYTSIINKLNGKRNFSYDEIEELLKILDLTKNDIPLYFFT